jgi:hypothetical protein
MKVRFQADADFNQNTVRAVRRRAPAIDFQTAHEAGLHGLDDQAVLAQAAREGRLLVSHDRRTMPNHKISRKCSAELQACGSLAAYICHSIDGQGKAMMA